MSLENRIAKLEQNKATDESTNEAFEIPISPYDAGTILQQLADLGVIPQEANEENLIIVKQLFGVEG